ncbi:hypothetical protein GVAV_001047 [Gurleya vavrai]
MFILLSILFLISIPLSYLIYKLTRKQTKTIKFVGPRNSGKTQTLQKLIDKKEVKTVPTLESYYIEQNNLVIHDIIPVKGKTFNEIYGLEDNSKYFFFFKEINDLVDYEKGFDVNFVYLGKETEIKKFSENLRNKLICLENEPENIRKYIECK